MEPQTDPARSAAFAARMLDVLNGGATALMLSLGHRAGLFDVMAGLDYATSAEIADEAGLCERYVREWLGAMVTSRIIEYCRERCAYRLPPAHAAVLTRGPGRYNFAATAQWIPLLGAGEDRVLACFAHGGGLPTSTFSRFHEVMAELSDRTVVGALHDAILPLLPGGVAALEAGIDVLDLGCGNGRALNEMAGAYPKSRFTGYDLSPDAIAVARAEKRERGLANIGFEVRDAADLHAREAFDLVTAFGSVHDMAHPAAVLAAVASALRPSGCFLMQDIAGTSHVDRDLDVPFAPLMYAVSCLHCTAVALSNDGAGLGAMWGVETARAMLEEAGLAALEIRSLPHDPVHLYFIARRKP